MGVAGAYSTLAPATFRVSGAPGNPEYRATAVDRVAHRELMSDIEPMAPDEAVTLCGGLLCLR
jgi:hypothetical protein